MLPRAVLGVLSAIPRFFVHPTMRPDTTRALMQEATDPAHAHLSWPVGAPLRDAHNAHRVNTPLEMEQALRREYNFLEGDIRLEGGLRGIPGLGRFREPIMAHDLPRTDGMTLREWLRIGEASGRGLKLDVKQAATVSGIIREVGRHNIPQERIIFNADVVRGPGGSRFLIHLENLLQDRSCSLDDVKALRAAFPRATIALGTTSGKQPAGTCYTDDQLLQLIEFATQIGGPVIFPLRAELVTPAVVRMLKPHGGVAIWNNPKTYKPRDIDADIQRFRQMGVDSMIDLRQ